MRPWGLASANQTGQTEIEAGVDCSPEFEICRVASRLETWQKLTIQSFFCLIKFNRLMTLAYEII